MGVIFGVGYEGLVETSFKGYSTSGLLNSFMMFGLVNCIIIYSYFIKQIARYSISKIEMIVCVFIIVNMGMSQPDLLPTLSILLAFYSMISDSNLKYNNFYIEKWKGKFNEKDFNMD